MSQVQSQNKKKKSTLESVGIVTKVTKETPDTHTLRISMPNLAEGEKPFVYKAGQFVMVRPVINGKTIPRAYSISSSPTRSESDNFFDLTVRQTQTPTVSKWLNDRQVNDEILFRGPYGQFFWEEGHPEASQLLLLGGGSGVTPLKSMIEYISDKKLGNKAVLLYSSKTEKDIILRKPLEELEKDNDNIKVEFSLTREPDNKDFRHGRIDLPYVQETLEEFDIDKTGCYMCGTPGFVENMTKLLEDAGIKEEKIWHERWE